MKYYRELEGAGECLCVSEETVREKALRTAVTNIEIWVISVTSRCNADPVQAPLPRLSLCDQGISVCLCEDSLFSKDTQPLMPAVSGGNFNRENHQGSSHFLARPVLRCCLNRHHNGIFHLKSCDDDVLGL